MSKSLKTISVDATILDAQNMMSEFRIRHLPVLNKNKKVVGVLSQRDIRAAKTLDHSVESLMSAPVESLSQDTPIRTAILRMLEKKISSLLISDEKDEIIGIVTTDDLLWFLASLLDQDENKDQPLLGAAARETIGQVANMLSNAGI